MNDLEKREYIEEEMRAEAMMQEKDEEEEDDSHVEYLGS